MDNGAKPRRLRSPDIVRGRILDAAQAEFMAAGYAGASTNRMLDRFGGSKPTMFRHFPTKRALFEGVVARIASSWAGQIAWRALPDENPAGWLASFAHLVLDWILADENIFVGRMAVAEGAAFPEIADIYRTLAVDPIEAVLADHLRDWTKAGLLTCIAPRRDATSFLDLTVSGIVSRRLYRVGDPPGQQQLEQHVIHAVALFLHGRTAHTP